MALFGKKRLTLDEILKGIDGLSDEEKAKVHAKMQDLDKAEDEREIDKIEEDKAETTEKADEKADEVKEESEEIGKDVDEVEEEVKTDEEGETATEEVAEEEKATEETEESTEEVESSTEEMAGENYAEIVSQLTDRVAGIEEQLKELTALKEEMESFVEKQRKTYGYEGKVRGGKKDYEDMTADELKREILGQN